MAVKLVGPLAAKGGQSHSRPLRSRVDCRSDSESAASSELSAAMHSVRPERGVDCRTRDEDATRVRIVVAEIALVDMGALGSAAGKRFASRMKVTPGRG